MNHYKSKGKLFELSDGNYNTELHHPCISRNLGMLLQQYKCFGSSAASKIQRNPLFSSLDSRDVSYFKEILGEKNVIEDKERLETANTDWMHKYKGSSKLMLLPKNTQEVFFFFSLPYYFVWIAMNICVKHRFILVQVSQILQYCDSRRLAVVPQGGNTGLVGGSVPVFDEVLCCFSTHVDW